MNRSVRWELPLVLVSIIVRLIILGIHSHGVDIFLPDVSKRALGHLIGQEEPPAARALADNRTGCVRGAGERHAIDFHLTVREQCSDPMAVLLATRKKCHSRYEGAAVDEI